MLHATTEQQAIEALHRLKETHGWSGTVMTKHDLEYVYEMMVEDAQDELDPDVDLPPFEKVWEDVRQGRFWTRVIPEEMANAGHEAMTSMLDEYLHRHVDSRQKQEPEEPPKKRTIDEMVQQVKDETGYVENSSDTDNP